jgi:hypothetical protein
MPDSKILTAYLNSAQKMLLGLPLLIHVTKIKIVFCPLLSHPMICSKAVMVIGLNIDWPLYLCFFKVWYSCYASRIHNKGKNVAQQCTSCALTGYISSFIMCLYFAWTQKLMNIYCLDPVLPRFALIFCVIFFYYLKGLETECSEKYLSVR